jgi:hypothetical protein
MSQSSYETADQEEYRDILVDPENPLDLEDGGGVVEPPQAVDSQPNRPPAPAVHLGTENDPVPADDAQAQRNKRIDLENRAIRLLKAYKENIDAMQYEATRAVAISINERYDRVLQALDETNRLLDGNKFEPAQGIRLLSGKTLRVPPPDVMGLTDVTGSGLGRYEAAQPGEAFELLNPSELQQQQAQANVERSNKFHRELVESYDPSRYTLEGAQGSKRFSKENPQVTDQNQMGESPQAGIRRLLTTKPLLKIAHNSGELQEIGHRKQSTLSKAEEASKYRELMQKYSINISDLSFAAWEEIPDVPSIKPEWMTEADFQNVKANLEALHDARQRKDKKSAASSYSMKMGSREDALGGSGIYLVNAGGQQESITRNQMFNTEMSQTFAAKAPSARTELLFQRSFDANCTDLKDDLAAKPPSSGYERGMLSMLKTMEILTTQDVDPEISRRKARQYMQSTLDDTLMAVQPPELMVRTPLKYDCVKIPKLGDRGLEAKIRKDTLHAIHSSLFSGVKENDVVTATDFLRTVGDVIEDSKLHASAAYALIKSCLTGRAYEFCVAQLELGVGFGYFWGSFNKLFHDRFDIEKAQTRLFELRRTKPVFIAQTVQAIVKYNRIANMHLDPTQRIKTTIASTRSDIEAILRRFYPFSVNVVMDREIAARDKWTAERDFCRRTGRELVEMHTSYHPLNHLVDVVCEELESVEALSPKVESFTEIFGRATRDKKYEGATRPGGRVMEIDMTPPHDPSRPELDEESDYLPTPGVDTDPDPEIAAFERRPAFAPGARPFNMEYVICTNCGILGHTWRKCLKYDGAEPKKTPCTSCKCYHKAACKQIPRAIDTR